MRKTEEILRSLLHQKGMDSQEDISEFLSDRPQKTYDPFLLYNMEAGVDLLLSEIKKDTKVCIYGDYDAVPSSGQFPDRKACTSDKISFYRTACDMFC